MRSLSTQQASACEHAQSKRCRCRCAGALHGADRGDVATLPTDDPHCPRLPAQLALPLAVAS